jgi:hypothetical protein
MGSVHLLHHIHFIHCLLHYIDLLHLGSIVEALRL